MAGRTGEQPALPAQKQGLRLPSWATSCLWDVFPEDDLQSRGMIIVGKISDALAENIQRLPRLDPGILVDGGIERPVEQARSVVRGQFMGDVYDSPFRRVRFQGSRNALVACTDVVNSGEIAVALKQLRRL